MLDIRLIRESPDIVKRELAKVAVPPDQIDRLLEVDTRRRAAITEVERLRAHRAETSKTIGKQAPEDRERLKSEMREVGERISALEKELEQLDLNFQARMLELPNIP